MKAYLAGPDVFRPDAAEAAAARKAVCAARGVEGLHPFDQDLVGVAERSLASAIFMTNVAMMRMADVVIAELTPFRGPGADNGTAFELGYAFALGKPVFGFSQAPSAYFDRVADGAPRETFATTTDGRTLGADGLAIEDFGLADNLMLIQAITASGGAFFTSAGGAWEAPDGLDPFEACVEAAARFAAENGVSLSSQPRRLAG